MRLLIAEGVKDDPRLREMQVLAESRRATVDRVPREELELLLPTVNHQGVALYAGEYPYSTVGEIAERPGTVLVLDHMQDPQNLGTLIRAAEAASVAGIVIPADRAAEITPAVVNASAGAVEHVLVAKEPNLSRAIETLKGTGRWALGLGSANEALDLYQADLPLPAILVVGSEGSGLTPIVRKACDVIVKIPMTGRIASLNAATAGSLAVFELVRREGILI